MRPSRANFAVDAKAAVRDITAAAATSTVYSQTFPLDALAAYWNTASETGLCETLLVKGYVSAISTGNGRSYQIIAQVDTASTFGSPTDVGTATLSATGHFTMSLSRDALRIAEADAAYLRFKIIPTSVYESGSIAFSSVANNGDTVTISDGTGTAVFTFAAAGNAATGAAVNVATGATAADSAQNLKTAIDANLTINVDTAGASTTITLTNAANPTGGAITKSDADNDYTVTDFSGGYQASITLWAYFQPECCC